MDVQYYTSSRIIPEIEVYSSNSINQVWIASRPSRHVPRLQSACISVWGSICAAWDRDLSCSLVHRICGDPAHAVARLSL